VTFVSGFVVRELVHDDDRVAGVRGSVGGVEAEARAPLVVGADGRYSLVSKAVNAPTYWRVPIGRLACYGYFRAAEGPRVPTMEIYVRGADWYYIFPTDGGLHMVAAGIDRRSRERFDGDRKAAFTDTLGRCPEIAERLLGAELIGGPLLAYSPEAANYLRRPYGRGWALVGDAGMYFDPTLGQGMGTALRSAEILAEELLRTVTRRSGRAWGVGLWRYELRRNLEFWDLYTYTCAMSAARPLSHPERWFYRQVAADRALTREYLGVASHASRVHRFLLYCVLHPWRFGLGDRGPAPPRDADIAGIEIPGA
jgi:flavin-dependent dehydrogenase